MTPNGPNPMPVWHGFLKPVLEVLADGKTWKVRELYTAVCDHVGLTEEQRAEPLASGKSRAENRIGWALSALYKAELITKPNRGSYVMNDEGRKFLEQHPAEISEKTLRQVPAYEAYLATIGAGQATAKSDVVEAASDEEADPLEMIENGVAALHGEVAAELIKRLREQDPSFLEQSVLDVLVAMGYGGTEKRATVLGGSGDRGVDGVIDQDPLGLERVYVQAKRYGKDNNVQRPDIQGFVGALHGVGANRGIFITTSQFSPGAREYAKNIGTRVVLIDGLRLAELMIKYGVGVQQRQVFTVVEVDEDYFE
ncbi:restriction endonuclease [Mycolicibacterium elephantis]